MSSGGERRPVTVIHAGRRYRIERGPGLQRETISEFWPGHGVVGSERTWLGCCYAKSVRWYAAVNPTGTPWQATHRVEGLRSHRAAVAWLLEHTAQPTREVKVEEMRCPGCREQAVPEPATGAQAGEDGWWSHRDGSPLCGAGAGRVEPIEWPEQSR